METSFSSKVVILGRRKMRYLCRDLLMTWLFIILYYFRIWAKMLFAFGRGGGARKKQNRLFSSGKKFSSISVFHLQTIYSNIGYDHEKILRKKIENKFCKDMCWFCINWFLVRREGASHRSDFLRETAKSLLRAWQNPLLRIGMLINQLKSWTRLCEIHI